ncbi:hypothetical protein A3A66_01075 [Microgenomates group bacterium RIFCSPLOWO2_01_FULL_46_13]|nr:MAG: hypothetical protein A2783_01180 [Microgenomates group bacterium RIFCSPHIGHO2_01_FULL_45_11]OGV94596.1 MAG: hypothetical protein A3A66_01075 [Microgenomates group bacterium RIFCSPLOWO2_01_FULL_46_13]
MAKLSALDLRVVIFAGGVGTRMWPLSRKKTPKQFEKMIDNQSTLQLAIQRVQPEVKLENIYISSGQAYKGIIKNQLPDIPIENIIGEPTMRDVAPAVGYLMAILAKKDPEGAVAILWSDHVMKHVNRFKRAIFSGAEYLSKKKDLFVFIGQEPRFANQNLGWIEFGRQLEVVNGFEVREFISWHYRPSLERANTYFDSDNHAWNPGYFVVTPKFVLEQFRKHVPEMYKGLMKLQASYGNKNHQKELEEIYPKFEQVHFDNAILEKISPHEAVVISVDLGWSDVGTWEAFKEALQAKPEDNLTKGRVVAWKTKNSLVFNYTNQLVSAIDLKGMVVVVTEDAILVTPQESIPEIKNMLKSFDGTEKEKYV